jgi:hypothetical protein
MNWRRAASGCRTIRCGCSCAAKGCASKKTLFALERARADITRHRRRWKAWQGRIDPGRLAFIDETWVRTNMAPLRGWGPTGKRLHGFAPHGRWRTLTFLGALRYDQLTAPAVFDGPINGVCFCAYVEQGSPADAKARRHCHHGQPRQPQIQNGPQSHPQRRCQIVVPAKVLPRSQPDRTGILSDQALDAHRSTAIRRRCLATYRTSRYQHHIRTMRQLFPECWLRFRQPVKRYRTASASIRRPSRSGPSEVSKIGEKFPCLMPMLKKPSIPPKLGRKFQRSSSTYAP